MKNKDFQKIEAMIIQYFEGLHFADVKKLEAIFHPDCVLKAPGIRRNLRQWFELIRNRQVPAERDDKMKFRIINIEIEGEQAMVKVSCPLLDSNFIDYLGLLKENDHWNIVTKMYADHPMNFAESA